MSKCFLLLAVIATAIIHTTSAREKTALDATSAEIITDSKRISLQSFDGLFDRAFIPESVSTKIHLTLPELMPGAEVSITAPNGGNIRAKAPSDLQGKTSTWLGGNLVSREGKLRFTPQQAGPVEIDLEFTPTLGRGAYTITIRQAGAVATLDLWAGKPNPIGQSGPAYVPVRSTEPEIVP